MSPTGYLETEREVVSRNGRPTGEEAKEDEDKRKRTKAERPGTEVQEGEARKVRPSTEPKERNDKNIKKRALYIGKNGPFPRWRH